MPTQLYRLAALTLLLATTVSLAADWPRWRGPDGLGVSPEKGLPVEWSNEKNVVWRIDLPGRGNSSPVVVGDRIYLTAQTEDEAHHVIAIDARKGAVVWDRVVGKGTRPAHKLNNMATPTPVADEERVWAFFGTGALVCLDREGKTLWERDLQEDHGKYRVQWGVGTSPLLVDGRVVLSCLHDGPSYLLAIDGSTGKDAWKQKRDLDSVGEARDAYSTPIVLRSEGRAAIVVCGADHVDAYDPRSGDRLWISSGLKMDHPYGRSVASATAGDGVVVAVSSGFRNQGRLMAVRAGGKGDVSTTRKLWTYEKYAPDCPTPVCYEGLVYVINDLGIASCLDLQTGERKWRTRLLDGNTKVSPVAGDGKVYFSGGSGECVVVRAGAEGTVLARNELGSPTLSTPAISGGRLYFRTREGLFAIGEK